MVRTGMGQSRLRVGHSSACLVNPTERRRNTRCSGKAKRAASAGSADPAVNSIKGSREPWNRGAGWQFSVRLLVLPPWSGRSSRASLWTSAPSMARSSISLINTVVCKLTLLSRTVLRESRRRPGASASPPSAGCLLVRQMVVGPLRTWGGTDALWTSSGGLI
jgi:hypothetical protein